MQNAKFGILATIGLVGLSILAGCQKPAKAPSAAPSREPSVEHRTRAVAQSAEIIRKWVELYNTGKSDPSPVTLSLHSKATPPGPPDRIVWVAKDDVKVCFNTSSHSPFADGSPNPHAPPVPGDNSYVVPKGEAVLSGPVRPGVPEGNYPYIVTTPTTSCSAPMARNTKDGIVIIKR